MQPPIIILSRPQMGENIGAAARVMRNFGLRELRIVSPRDGWPNPAAEAMAAGGADIIAAAKVYDSTREAVADCHYVMAATARDREIDKPVFTPKEAFANAASPHPTLSPRRGLELNPLPGERVAQAGEGVKPIKTAILFGCERSGLDNEEVALAHAIMSIPVSAEYGSLNLAMAVGVVAYEFYQASVVRHQASVGENLLMPDARCLMPRTSLAPQAELHGFFDHLEAELDTRNFWKEPKKKPVMWRNIRSLFLRAGPSSQEVRTLRGLVRCLSERD